MNNKFSFLVSDFNEGELDTFEEKKNTAPKAQAAVSEVKPTPTSKAETHTQEQPTEESKGRHRGGKRSDPDYKVVGIQLPIALHRKAKELLLKDGDERNFSELMTQLLSEWVNETQE